MNPTTITVRTLLLCGILLVISASITRAQTTDFVPIVQHGGSYLPSKGDVRGLMVFLQTKDDREYDPDWMRDSMPSWGQRLADAIQTYMAAMSQGALNLRLDVYPRLMVPPLSEEDYRWKIQDYGNAAIDVLSLMDTTLDFSPYDNWSSSYEPFQVKPGPDRKVDLIVFIYRFLHQATFFPFDGVSDLGFWGNLQVDDSARYIFGGTRQFNDAGSTGLTFGRRSAFPTNFNWAFRVAVHEIMHKIWGDSHVTDLYCGLGLMGQYSGGVGMSAFERETLGWFSPRVVPHDVDTTFVLRDCMTTGDALIYQLPGTTGIYYSIEFRARRSPYDGVPSTGVYISTVSDTHILSQKRVLVQSADGRWVWRYDPQIRKPVKWYPDALRGQNAFQILYLDNNNYIADAGYGDSTAAFRPEQPWFRWTGNPSPDILVNNDTIHTRLNFHVDAMNDSTATVSFHYDRGAILGGDAVEPPADAGISVHPNPVAHGSPVVTLRTHSLTAGSAELRITDMLGRTIDTRAVDVPASGIVQIASSTLPRGVFALTLLRGAWRLTTRLSIQ